VAARRPRRPLVGLALVIVAMCTLVLACGSKSPPAKPAPTWKVEPTPRSAVRHRAHEHPHGPHPHAGGGHHHHPHPHPHLDGPGGHHHPY
jgi:hypothetical protein